MFLSCIVEKLNGEIVTFGAIEIQKRKLHYSKYLVNIKSVDVAKIILPSKVSFVKKKFLNTLLVTKMKKKLSH